MSMKTRKQKPKTQLTIKSRNTERQTLKGRHLGRVESPKTRRQAPAPIAKTMHLPAVIELPRPIKGESFSYEFTSFEYAGTKANRIGQVRKQYFTLWKSTDARHRGGLIIEIPDGQQTVRVSHIRAEIERVRISQDVKPAPRRLPRIGSDNWTHDIVFRQRPQ